MKPRTIGEIENVWNQYKPLTKVDPSFAKLYRVSTPNALDERISKAVRTKGENNPLLEMIADRDEVMGITHQHQGTDIADLFWNLFNWSYFQHQDEEKKKHLYRLAVVAGYFMEKKRMHPEMINAVAYADRFV